MLAFALCENPKRCAYKDHLLPQHPAVEKFLSHGAGIDLVLQKGNVNVTFERRLIVHVQGRTWILFKCDVYK